MCTTDNILISVTWKCFIQSFLRLHGREKKVPSRACLFAEIFFVWQLITIRLSKLFRLESSTQTRYHIYIVLGYIQMHTDSFCHRNLISKYLFIKIQRVIRWIHNGYEQKKSHLNYNPRFVFATLIRVEIKIINEKLLSRERRALMNAFEINSIKHSNAQEPLYHHTKNLHSINFFFRS